MTDTGKGRDLTAVRYDSATIRALAFKLSFISLISRSTSFINLWGIERLMRSSKDLMYSMMKSTILCFSMVSEWVLVIKKEISYPWKVDMDKLKDAYGT